VQPAEAGANNAPRDGGQQQDGRQQGRPWTRSPCPQRGRGTRHPANPADRSRRVPIGAASRSDEPAQAGRLSNPASASCHAIAQLHIEWRG
jgi:hypothetical protein